MKYIKLGKTDETVSTISLGTWAFGGPGTVGKNIPVGWADQSKDDSIRVLKKSHDSGINHWDTADVYGDGISEKIIGEVWKDISRSSIFLATKVGWDMGEYDYFYHPKLIKKNIVVVIGGDGFIMMFDKSNEKVSVINATGPAPELSNQIKDSLNYKGIKSSSVPGLVSGVIKMHKTKGSMPLGECLKPAITAASEGIPLSEDQDSSLKIESEMNRFDSSMKIWGKNNILKSFGEKIINQDLAKTLSLIADNGQDVFYKGKIAEKIVNYSNANGGYITKKDLENFDAEIV